MKGASWCVVLLLAGCGATLPPKAPADAPAAGALVTLRNPGFEIDAQPGAKCATGWSCTMHADPKSFRFFAGEAAAGQGKRSFCIEPAGKEPWALVAQGLFDRKLQGTRVKFSVAMNLAGVAGRGAGPWIQAKGGAARPVTSQKLVTTSQPWETHAVELDVPEGATTVEVGVMLRGIGRACFDDARLEVLRGKKNPV